MAEGFLLELNFSTLKQTLEEKLLIVGGNKKYGQVLILAGGAGSGKGFILSNLIGMGGYKVVDPDAFKIAFLRRKEIVKNYPEITSKCNPDMVPTSDKPCLKDPSTVSKLHMIMRELGWEEKTKKALVDMRAGRTKDTLPNIVYDRTMKETGGLLDDLKALKDAGYQPENIHMVWVLTDYRIAMKQNLARDRVVPPEILFATHNGAAKTMLGMTQGGYPSTSLINGEVWTVVGRANLVSSGRGGSYIAAPNPSDTNALKFIRLKKAGGSFDTPDQVWNKLGCHICNKTPLETTPICSDKPPKCS